MSEGIVTVVQNTIFKFLVLNNPILSEKSYLHSSTTSTGV